MIKLALLFLLPALILSGCKSSVIESRPDSPRIQFSYSNSQKAHVKLTVENMYNSIVANLQEEDMPAGTHGINFSIKNITSGSYYFIMEAKGIDNNYYEKSVQNFSVVLK